MRRSWLVLIILLLAGLLSAAPARTQDHIVFGLNWRAECGGYYQPLATGLHAVRGLDVTIRQGGRKSITCRLIAGRLDFNLGGGRAIEFAQVHLPLLAVAVIFQKELARPRSLWAPKDSDGRHDSGLETSSSRADIRPPKLQPTRTPLNLTVPDAVLSLRRFGSSPTREHELTAVAGKPGSLGWPEFWAWRMPQL
jgi:hypothetical protein